MPRTHHLHNNLSAGELSPLMLARVDFERYHRGAEIVENWRVLTQGGVTRREGTRFVAGQINHTARSWFLPFEPSDTQAYMLELGHQKMRFYRDGAQILLAGVPYEIATPYSAPDLPVIDYAQSKDVLYLVHPDYPPQKLSRFADTDWRLRPVVFSPPPSTEYGTEPAANLTPGALTGSAVTLTANANVFRNADKGREIITKRGARATITEVVSQDEIVVKIDDPFVTLGVIPGGDWRIAASPVAELEVEGSRTKGSKVTLALRRRQDDLPNLITNGFFSSGIELGWIDLSAPILATGTHGGADGVSRILQDNSKDFLAFAIRPTQTLRNTTTGSVGQVTSVTQHVITFAELVGSNTPSADDFDPGDEYEIRATGSAAGAQGGAQLSGGTAGYGWIQQAVDTTNGVAYRVQFNVTEAPLSARVGSSSGTADLAEEFTYEVGKRHSMIFVAEGATSYVQFRNNQNVTSTLDNVTMRVYTISGFRGSDVGKFVKYREGVIRILTVDSLTEATGIVEKTVDSTEPAPAGTWTLEDPSWSEAWGYPQTIDIFSECLILGGSPNFPETIWKSRGGDFERFGGGTNPDDSAEYTIASKTTSEIRWLDAGRSLLVGTSGNESQATGGDTSQLTPDGARIRIQSTYGSARIRPLRVGNLLVFVQRRGSKVRTLRYNFDSDSYLAPELSLLSGHLLEGRTVVQMVCEPEPISTLWLVRDDGVLLGVTFEEAEQVIAWYRVVTDGFIETIAITPATATPYARWVGVRRVINGVTKRFVEIFDPVLQMDAGLTYSGAPATTFSGLGHLVGEMVDIVGDGAVYQPQVVPPSGSITLSPLHPVSTASIGLHYRSPLVTLPLEIPVSGTSQMSQKRQAEISVRLYQTSGLTINGQQLPFHVAGTPLGEVPPPFTGDKRVTNLGWDRAGRITISQDLPLPATVLAIMSTVVVGD